MKIIATIRYHADNDPDETPFSNPVDANRHGDRLAIVKKIRAHMANVWVFGAEQHVYELTNNDWIEIVSIVQRETPT